MAFNNIFSAIVAPGKRYGRLVFLVTYHKNGSGLFLIMVFQAVTLDLFSPWYNT